MGDLIGILADSPLPHRKTHHILLWAGVILAVILLATVAWAAPVHFDDVQESLSVSGEFIGFSKQVEGHFVYAKEQPLIYKVVIRNIGNRTVPELRVQSSLHSDGASCGGRTMNPGSLLPGPSISPEQPYVLAPGSEASYEAIYDAAAADCATTGHLRVRVQYPLGGRTQAVTLTSPIRFRID